MRAPRQTRRPNCNTRTSQREEAPAVPHAPASSSSDEASNQILIRMMNEVRRVLEDIVDKDCYDRISESSQRKRASKMDYERNYGVAVADLNCMITGISQSALHAPAPTSPMPENPVTCSYLLPRSAYATDRESLGYKMDDIESIRNTLLLCKGIERAFYRKKLSFVPADNPFSNNQY
eukprot:gene15017-10737_t